MCLKKRFARKRDLSIGGLGNSAMTSIKQAVKRKGIRGTTKRIIHIAKRYGFSSCKMKKNLLQLINLSPSTTLPITAVTLERHYDIIPHSDSVEYALHGYVHVDYSKLSSETVEKHLRKALQIFHTNKVDVKGFRAPYLQWNDSSTDILKSLGFLYNSSRTIHWDVVPEKYLNTSYNLALSMYASTDANKKSSLPYIKDGIVCIPISLPDDEMLIDRLGIRDQNLLYNIWVKILEETNERHELFVLQLHPERINLANHALTKLIKIANQKSIWIATLKDVAEWWKTHAKEGWPGKYKSAFCVTGDIDVMGVWDYRFMREKKNE